MAAATPPPSASMSPRNALRVCEPGAPPQSAEPEHGCPDHRERDADPLPRRRRLTQPHCGGAGHEHRLEVDEHRGCGDGRERDRGVPRPEVEREQHPCARGEREPGPVEGAPLTPAACDRRAPRRR